MGHGAKGQALGTPDLFRIIPIASRPEPQTRERSEHA